MCGVHAIVQVNWCNVIVRKSILPHGSESGGSVGLDESQRSTKKKLSHFIADGSAQLREHVLSMEAKIIGIVSPPPEGSMGILSERFQIGTPL